MLKTIKFYSPAIFACLLSDISDASLTRFTQVSLKPELTCSSVIYVQNESIQNLSIAADMMNK